MQIAEFQRWTRDTDRETQWDLITTPQLISHLTEEMGEVARSVNRIYGYAEEKKKLTHQANLGLELIEVFWFLAKIANRFSIDLDAEASDFIENADEWQGKYFDDLMSSLRALDQELAKAKNGLDLRVPCVAAILRTPRDASCFNSAATTQTCPLPAIGHCPAEKSRKERRQRQP